MTAESVPRPAPPPGPPRRRWPGRAAAMLLMVGLPALGAAGLGWLWARGLRFAEVVTLAHDGGVVAASGASATYRSALQVESALGVLGVSLTRDRAEHAAPPPALVAPIRAAEAAGSYGWHLDRQDKAWLRKPTQRFQNLVSSLLGVEVEDYLPFGRPRDNVDAGRTLHWRRTSATEPTTTGGTSRHAVDRLVMPVWLWMLPLALPPLWWAWCPRGRMLPRLTIRRTLVATALAALALAPLATFARASAADRALEALDEASATWTYGPDPNGSGRRVVTDVTIPQQFVTKGGTPVVVAGVSVTVNGAPARIGQAPDVGRLRDALASLPGLRSLTLSAFIAPTAADLAAMVGGLPRLEVLHLESTQADDATLQALRGHPNLRELYLDSTAVTAAGLAHLRGLPRLEVLWLEGVPLTDAGLAHLAGLPKLRRLNLLSAGRSATTEDALRHLADSLPAFEVLWRPDGTALRKPGG